MSKLFGGLNKIDEDDFKKKKRKKFKKRGSKAGSIKSMQPAIRTRKYKH